MLRGDDHGIHALHLAWGAVFDRDLGFSIGTQVGAGAIFANFGKFLGQLVGEGNRKGHQFRSLIAGEAEHHSLVAGAAGVYAHGNVAGLLVDAGNHRAGIGVEAVDGVVVADGLNYAAHQALEVHVSFGGNFAGDDDQAGAGQGFTGDAAGGVFTQAGVENGIGNLVGDLVGMSFGNRFRGKQKTIS